ncbi:MAG: hypothetical protein Q7S83_02105 [bacterium]|nr:hypothetical protein [bacterium]
MYAVITADKPFARDMRERGWKLKRDVEVEHDLVVMDICGFHHPEEGLIHGNRMAIRALELDANLGQRHAEALLERQNFIPHSWTNFYLIFPGTVWNDPQGKRRVPFLGYNSDTGKWVLDFILLDQENWCGIDKLMRAYPAA